MYKQEIRKHIPQFVPYYPLGMPDLTRPELPAARGTCAPAKEMVAVWRRNGPEAVFIPGRMPGARVLYPADLGVSVAAEAAGIRVRLPAANMGCIVSSES